MMIKKSNYFTVFKVVLFFLSFSIVSCWQEDKVRRVANDGLFEEGLLIDDSIFHGVVKRYDSSNNYQGYAVYSYGLKNGIYVSKYLNGKTKDSIFFLRGEKNGFSFHFDSIGQINYKMNFVCGRPIGDSYVFDSLGNVKEYGFRNYEGVFIYYLKYENNQPYSTGELVNYKLDTVEIDGKDKMYFFSYLVRPPGLDIKYKIARVFENRILSIEEEIAADQIFYESTFDFLSKDNFYALVVSVFNTAKNKDDLMVYVLR